MLFTERIAHAVLDKTGNPALFARMKILLSLLCGFILTLTPMFAQDATVKSESTSNESTNKPDLKTLLALPSFTNDTGMVLLKISDALWVGVYEVTQKEYQKVAGGNPSQFQGAQNPVDNVSWTDAMNFCAKLDEAEKKEKLLPEGFAYTLPTQAQWETLAAGAELKDAVTSWKTQRASTAPGGSLGATGPGIYDIRGNVWEWCLDPQDKPFRVLRGAAWNSWIEINLRPDFRWYSDGPDQKKNTFGFRCVLAPKGGSPSATPSVAPTSRY
jgi:hypothetical protein